MTRTLPMTLSPPMARARPIDRSRSAWLGFGSLAFLAVIAAALLVSAAPAQAGERSHDRRGDREKFSFSIRVGDHHKGASVRYEHRSRDHHRNRGWRHHDRRDRYDDHHRHRSGRDYHHRDRGYRHHDRDRHYHRDRHYDRHRPSHGYVKPVHRSGCWKRVYVPPVYRYRYDSCGNYVRVCVRAGYWKRIYIRGGHHRY